MRKAFPDRTILADMKTVDTGAMEVEMAAKAGADVVIVLGSADDSIIPFPQINIKDNIGNRNT